ncbi:apolipoprotein D-like [Amblyomma americanum]
MAAQLSLPLLVTAALVAATSPASCQVIDIGPCPAVKVQDKLDPNKFSGKWFEIERTFARYANNQRLHCVSVEYYYDGQGKFSAVNSAVLPNGHTNRVLGELTVLNQTEPAKMSMRFYARNPEQRPFWVLYTDYDKCAIVYRCRRSLWLHTMYVWILCRNHTVTEPYLANLRGYVQQWTGIPARLFSKTPCK